MWVQFSIGRLDSNTFVIRDDEVSGQHAIVRWDPVDKCWQVADIGSLNGTMLNGITISAESRCRGREFRLSSDDILQLGSYSRVKVSF